MELSRTMHTMLPHCHGLVRTVRIVFESCPFDFITSDCILHLTTGIEHGAAGKVASKVHEQSVLTVHMILTSKQSERVLERQKIDRIR